MKKKILLPTDFSKNAWNAILYAIELYKNETCDFYVLNVFNATGYALESMMIPEPGERFYEEAKEKSEKGLSKIEERLSFRDDNPNHKFFMISQFNNVLSAIKDTVEKKDIEMIVMGTKGTTNAGDLIYGSNTVLVMEKVRNCPVMAIPENTNYKEPKEIVFPTDYRTQIKRRELQYLIEIARITNAEIRILHVTNDDDLDEEQENNKRLLVEYLDGIKYTFHTLHNIDVKGGLSSFVESRESDMITFINRKHSFFGSIFSRPMVKNLGQHSQVPVLALHDLAN
ncbi:nucleotide-binding universal stress UspA family protein [Aquimarina sp. EL_43]|uniref:universal stress protein n=1 Tax=Aquimarina TaxID=290174 RepID=UPI00046ECED9|nr:MULTISPECIES: universal stress protein [Aquimarina]MBG6131837.1 nucleotide-binding universal stress UspA family protein [Aquimarina sp. EL_35]MBG6149401.1 nucleotide-binding universal stress UspA family protein [Aquimarina sp. EL_32]MBG6170336.1 nucleotide-binding universal stress UspA family protein [Aquimarina sp. EL_43]